MQHIVLIAALSLNFTLSVRADDTTAISNAVHNLLNAGFQTGRVPIGDLEEAYNKSVSEIGRADSRLDYAYSIVLRKNFNAAEGQKHLEAAAKSLDPIVFLAREELILSRLKKRGYQDVTRLLVELSKQIGKIPANSPQFQEAKRSASWIGEVLAFLEGPLGNSDAKKSARAIESVIAQQLGETFVGTYQNGRLQTSLRWQELLSQINQIKEIVQDEKNALSLEAKEKSKLVDEQQKQFSDKVEEFQDVANDELSDLDSKLGVLETQFEVSLETERAMVITATGLRLELQQLKRDYEFNTSSLNGEIRPQRVTQVSDRYLQQIDLIERELLVLSNDYSLLLGSRNDLISLAKQMLNKRAQLVSRYQSAAVSASAARARISRMQQKISKIEEKAFSSLDADPKVIAQLRSVKSFLSYEKRNLYTKRELLVKSLELQ